MFNCQKCQKWFRDSCDLNRHLTRNKPCAKENSVGKSSVNEKSLTPTEKSLTPTEKSLTPTENNTCKYCLHTFTRIDNKNIHGKTCKYSDDPIRILEIKNDIIPEIPESKTECRFCNKIFSRIDNLNTHITICKERKVYHKILIKEKEQKNGKGLLSISNETATIEPPILNEPIRVNSIKIGNTLLDEETLKKLLNLLK